MVAIDGLGFEEAPTNMALMVFSGSEVYTDNASSNSCVALKIYETL